VQICSAILARVGHLDLIRYLDFRRAVVASGDQVEARLDARSWPLLARRRFRPLFTVIVLIAGLTILSAHFPP
jgi:hypothetical protein